MNIAKYKSSQLISPSITNDEGKKNTKIKDSDKHSIRSVSLTGFEADITDVTWNKYHPHPPAPSPIKGERELD
jgi:hypothetical protein